MKKGARNLLWNAAPRFVRLTGIEKRAESDAAQNVVIARKGPYNMSIGAVFTVCSHFRVLIGERSTAHAIRAKSWVLFLGQKSPLLGKRQKRDAQ